MFYYELGKDFDIPLLPHQVLSYEQAKRLFVDVKGRLNMSIQNWKKSGNVKLNYLDKELKFVGRQVLLKEKSS